MGGGCGFVALATACAVARMIDELAHHHPASLRQRPPFAAGRMAGSKALQLGRQFLY